MKKLGKSWISCVLLAAAMLFSGCFTDDGGDEEERKKLEEQVNSCASPSDSLGVSLTKLSEGDFQYGKEHWPELQCAHDAFSARAKLDGSDKEAKLGASLTGMLLAVQSENLDQLLDDAEANSPFSVSIVTESDKTSASLLKRIAKMAEFPEFHEFQDAIADSVLPVLDQAITDLEAVHADPAFSMTMTVENETKEIDQVEVGILLAGFKVLRSMVTMVLAYDIDIDQNGSYDFIDVLETIEGVDDPSNLTATQEAAVNHLTSLLTPGSAFLTARSEYKSRLTQIQPEILAAIELVRGSLVGIDQETDSQTDDVLTICSLAPNNTSCMSEADRSEAIDVLDSLKKYASGPVDVEIPDLDTTIKINPSIIFGQIQDYKKFLPYYSFYTSSEWSEEKPIIYFTNSAGTKTGDLKDVVAAFEDTTGAVNNEEDLIDSLKTIIKLQDPTFQGFLPGATEDGVWDLVLRMIKSEEQQVTGNGTGTINGAAKRKVYSLLDPSFPLQVLSN